MHTQYNSPLLVIKPKPYYLFPELYFCLDVLHLHVIDFAITGGMECNLSLKLSRARREQCIVTIN